MKVRRLSIQFLGRTNKREHYKRGIPLGTTDLFSEVQDSRGTLHENRPRASSSKCSSPSKRCRVIDMPLDPLCHPASDWIPEGLGYGYLEPCLSQLQVHRAESVASPTKTLVLEVLQFPLR